MKPFYTKATTDFDQSITIRYDELPNFYQHWHYHDEYELVFIHKGSGVRYIGDGINPFNPGDFVLIGSKLPHIWINDKQHEDSNVAATIIHFQQKFIQNDFINLPLMKDVKNLFEKSQQGIKFSGINNIEKSFIKIKNAVSTKKIIATLELLHKLINAKNTELLSSKKFKNTDKNQSSRLQNVHNYIAQHFREQIELNTLAQLAYMTPQAFCSYFKNKSHKPVFTYINDLKIGYSCKLLIDTDFNISQISIKSGYNNTTFFNRKFKAKMKMTPKEYRKLFKFNTES